MVPISETVYTFDADAGGATRTSGGLLRAAASPTEVSSYTDLLRRVATIAYYNRQFSLLFRGQSRDHALDAQGRAGVHSHLYPSIFRTVPAVSGAAAPMRQVYERRFAILLEAERLLKATASSGAISRDQVLRWALLQHYDVCPTPLLDVTSSLQVAVSFALEKSASDGVLYVLGVPHLASAVSVSLESGTVVVRLDQVCPPEVLRPHFQEGSLIGTYPALETEDFLQRPTGKLNLNMAGRLIEKFRLVGSDWGQGEFRPTAADILRPDDIDPYFRVMSQVRSRIRPELDRLHASTS